MNTLPPSMRRHVATVERAHRDDWQHAPCPTCGAEPHKATNRPDGHSVGLAHRKLNCRGAGRREIDKAIDLAVRRVRGRW